MYENPVISIIIACKEIGDYAEECIKHCRQLDYENYEIILLPDSVTENVQGVKAIPAGPVTPGAKRNIGVANSDGEICAFIARADARPEKSWLRNAISYFKDSEVAAVGGPGITPPECARYAQDTLV
jgi:cellulose synthase/poly-beta-1,6-N-acetylglucosamine synthase-like glycosyltransferase